jgi:short-subunit dehydrogenase
MPHPRIPALIRLHLGLPAWLITGATSGFGRRAADAGWLDVLVNNAGYGLFGSVEQTPAAEARAVIDTV